MKKKHHKIKRYTFSDKVQDLRNKTLNYSINLIFGYILAIPVILYFGNMNYMTLDVFLFLATLFVMAVIELLHAVINHKEYIEVESQLNAISRASLDNRCCCADQQPTYDTVATRS